MIDREIDREMNALNLNLLFPFNVIFKKEIDPIGTNRPLNSSMQWIWFHLRVKPKTITCFHVTFDWQRDRTTNLFLKGKQNQVYEPKGRLTSWGQACCSSSRLDSLSQEKQHRPPHASPPRPSVLLRIGGGCVSGDAQLTVRVSLWEGLLKHGRTKQRRRSKTKRFASHLGSK